MVFNNQIMKDNNVKGIITTKINSSHGKEGHVQSVSPDRYPAAVSKTTKNDSRNGIKYLGIYSTPSKGR